MENFIAQNIKAILVATNYNFSSTEEFFETLESRNFVKKYDLQKVPVKIVGNIPAGSLFVPDISGFIPFSLISNNTKIKLVYNGPEAKLVIDKDKFCIDNDFENFKNLSIDVLDLKTSDIKAIGLNFSADFNLGNIKLNLLNNNVVEIDDFEKNLTFEFVLPIDYPDENLVATYRIKKISGGDNTGEDRIYNISVNYHFDVFDLNTSEKISKIKTILEKNYYVKFMEKCQGFLNLNDSKK